MPALSWFRKEGNGCLPILAAATARRHGMFRTVRNISEQGKSYEEILRYFTRTSKSATAVPFKNH